ncbi:FAD-dependent oxidoreductase [Mesorhizobium sp. RMAD-H1]|uniref:NAD(P)/FAD-dependent oxidoreductase n=1 Tax=Mesorhizobium sp. RMAD-H1 TaxID=2587065 RepID=UPI00160BEFE4|nr:FAD-dependent oxidoreductase [Mesorhizobium sp. RMAD-H1]MBB2971558.1 3-phenylpropionate/trans-cinnamate dioxygenase ferredoxin reductase subunit [Mesorhizobium sp. RMAD-H1]
MALSDILIVGAGHAGFHLAAALRQAGYSGRVRLIGDEPGLPYQRPPLSKAYLAPDACDEMIEQRPQAFFADNRIELVTPNSVMAIDRVGSAVELAGGQRIGYDHLVLATGARNRQLAVPGADLTGIFYLRTAEDARCLRARLETCRQIVVIGAGFIGLEFAATAAKRGARVTIIEQAERVMARAVSPEMSACFERLHRSWGTEFMFGSGVAEITGRDGAVATVETSDGHSIPADLVLVGIGVVPNAELAAAAGLPTDNGILVDATMATADPHVSAIGDCASHPNPFAGRSIRLESVQNASDQARLLAARLTGQACAPYAAVPWFWSDQGPAKLQIAGIAAPGDESVLRGDPDEGAFSVFRFRGGRLTAVESLERPGDHMGGRQMLARNIPITAEEAADPAFDLKVLLKALPAAAE